VHLRGLGKAIKYDHGPLLVGRSKVVKANIAAGYSAGHAASDSQESDSLRVWGSFA
jgi:hypothetical protein